MHVRLYIILVYCNRIWSALIFFLACRPLPICFSYTLLSSSFLSASLVFSFPALSFSPSHLHFLIFSFPTLSFSPSHLHFLIFSLPALSFSVLFSSPLLVSYFMCPVSSLIAASLSPRVSSPIHLSASSILTFLSLLFSLLGQNRQGQEHATIIAFGHLKLRI